MTDNVISILADLPLHRRIALAAETQRINQSRPGVVPASQSAPTPQQATVAKLVDTLNATPGPNPVAKMITLLSRNASFAALSWAEKNRIAGEAYRSVLKGELPVLQTVSTFEGLEKKGESTTQTPTTEKLPVDAKTAVAQLNAETGPNVVAKAIGLLSKHDPTFAAKPWAEQNCVAGNFVRELLQGRVSYGGR